MKLRSLLGLMSLLFFTASLSAQSSDFGNWLMYFGNKDLPGRFNLHHEVQYRNYNVVGDLEQLLLRAGVGYNLTEGNNNLLFGYGYIRSGNYVDQGGQENKVFNDEHRIYQQFVTNQQFGRFNLSHRYRIEERIVNEDFLVRFRYFLNLKVALTNPTIVDETLYFVTYNELFINTENTIFSRNRLYGGLGYKLNKDVSFELGYMNQFFSVGGRDQLNIGVFWKY